MTKYEYKPLTPEQKAAENKLYNSPENKKVRRAIVQAYVNGDKEEVDRLMKILIAPIRATQSTRQKFRRTHRHTNSNLRGSK